MIYHAYNGSVWRVFGATSSDQGLTWQRHGEPLLQGQEGAWDSKGIGTRSIIRYKDGWLMFYEAVDDSLTHRVGAAYCANKSGLGPWEKLHMDEALLEPGVAPLEDWTNVVIGTPQIVEYEGKYLLYYVAKGKAEKDSKMAIGVLEADGDVLKRSSWRSAQV
jgi:predicted GH43/DUF377 family glycosyl hydrolase